MGHLKPNGVIAKQKVPRKSKSSQQIVKRTILTPDIKWITYKRIYGVKVKITLSYAKMYRVLYRDLISCSSNLLPVFEMTRKERIFVKPERGQYIQYYYNLFPFYFTVVGFRYGSRYRG